MDVLEFVADCEAEGFGGRDVEFFVVSGPPLVFLPGQFCASLMDDRFSHAILKESSGLLGHNRRAEIIALCLAAAVALKEFELRPGFHPLGNHPLLQAVAEIDHGADDSRVSRVRRDLLDERLMEFQGV